MGGRSSSGREEQLEGKRRDQHSRFANSYQLPVLKHMQEGYLLACLLVCLFAVEGLPLEYLYY